jgi:hypothetical protein
MPIQFECNCGKRLQAKDEHAGKRTKCPACGKTLVIGAAPAPTMPLVDPVAFSKPSPAVPPPPPLPGQAPMAFAPPPMFAPQSPYQPYGMGYGTADQSPSPLSEEQLNDLKATELLRRRIRHAAIWFRIQYLITLIFLILATAGMVISLATAGQNFRPEGAAVVGTGLAFYAGIAFLFYYAHKSTMECQRWAPLTMMILNCLAALLIFLSGFLADTQQRDQMVGVIAGLVGGLLPALIAYICYRAWDAIPKFLAQPQWCQNTLRHCDL